MAATLRLATPVDLPANHLYSKRFVCGDCGGIFPQKWLCRVASCTCDVAFCGPCIEKAAEEERPCTHCLRRITPGQPLLRQRWIQQCQCLGKCLFCGASVNVDFYCNHLLVCPGPLPMRYKADVQIETIAVRVAAFQGPGWGHLFNTALHANVRQALLIAMLPKDVVMVYNLHGGNYTPPSCLTYRLSLSESQCCAQILSRMKCGHTALAALQADYSTSSPTHWQLFFSLLEAQHESKSVEVAEFK